MTWTMSRWLRAPSKRPQPRQRPPILRRVELLEDRNAPNNLSDFLDFRLLGHQSLGIDAATLSTTGLEIAVGSLLSAEWLPRKSGSSQGNTASVVHGSGISIQSSALTATAVGKSVVDKRLASTPTGSNSAVELASLLSAATS